MKAEFELAAGLTSPRGLDKLARARMMRTRSLRYGAAHVEVRVVTHFEHTRKSADRSQPVCTVWPLPQRQQQTGAHQMRRKTAVGIGIRGGTGALCHGARKQDTNEACRAQLGDTMRCGGWVCACVPCGAQDRL